MSKRAAKVLTTAAVALAILAGLLAFGVGRRTQRIEQIRNELAQLELGMTMEEVDASMTIEPSSMDEVDNGARQSAEVVWWFSTRPRIEAVQPHVVFDTKSGRLIDVVLGTGLRSPSSEARPNP